MRVQSAKTIILSTITVDTGHWNFPLEAAIYDKCNRVIGGGDGTRTQ